MLYHFLFTLLSLSRVSMATVAQTCVWKDGSIATNFLPCTNSTATSGSCCLSGESCLGSGLCYGSIGLVYRGACINTWGGDCPTYCDDIASEWANLLPCPFANTGSSDGPQSFWCGATGTTACTASNESHFLTVLPSVATKLLIPSSTASVISSTGSSGTSTSSPGPTSAAANANESQPSSTAVASVTKTNGTAIGLGVALGVVSLAFVLVGAWAYRLHRRQKELMNASMMQQGHSPEFPPKPEVSNYSDYGVHREMGGVPQPTELEVGRAELGDR